MGAFKKFVLWDYARATWQYDVMVALILAFVFLTPRETFQDQPRAASIAMVRDGYWIEAQQFADVPDSELLNRANSLVQSRFKSKVRIVSIEPIYDDAEQELKGYLAFPKR